MPNHHKTIRDSETKQTRSFRHTCSCQDPLWIIQKACSRSAEAESVGRYNLCHHLRAPPSTLLSIWTMWSMNSGVPEPREAARTTCLRSPSAEPCSKSKRKISNRHRRVFQSFKWRRRSPLMSTRAIRKTCPWWKSRKSNPATWTYTLTMRVLWDALEIAALIKSPLNLLLRSTAHQKIPLIASVGKKIVQSSIINKS